MILLIVLWLRRLRPAPHVTHVAAAPAGPRHFIEDDLMMVGQYPYGGTHG